tara:strand:- start:32 stop:454 length:423 start_codon:yes stop_codon:yes gene_type:complete
MPRNVKFDAKMMRDANMEMQTLKVSYDFAVDGGTAGAITLKDAFGDAASLPDNAVIVGAWVEGITDLASGGNATVALGYTGAATALVGATAKNHATWDVGSVTALALSKTTQKSSILATIATADLTAGKFDVMIHYYIGA